MVRFLGFMTVLDVGFLDFMTELDVDSGEGGNVFLGWFVGGISACRVTRCPGVSGSLCTLTTNSGTKGIIVLVFAA